MFDRLGELASEHAELERALADPGVHADQDQARDFGRRYAELTPIVNAYTEWQQTEADEATARELAPEDPSFAAEADQLKKRKAELGSSCGGCSFPATLTTAGTSSWRSRRVRAARSPLCSPATCCACTSATPSVTTGPPKSSTPPLPASAASRPRPSR